MEDLVSKFVNYFFPPSKTTNLKNDITNFQQKFDETFSEAWDRFKELLRKCPHHGFSELHQIDTFYNALTQSDQDSLNAAAGGNLLNRTPRDALTIIENKSKVRTSRNKPIVSKVSTTTSSSSPSPDITALTDIVKELVLMNKANQQASVKAVEETCVTCGGPHPYYECLATDSNTFNAYAATGTYNQGGNGYRPQGDPNYHASNQMGPPGFPLNVQNNQNYNRYNQNQGNYQAPNNQGRGQNFNQGNNNYQAPNFQAQVGPSNELTSYMKSNEATLRPMQTQMTNMKMELRNEFKSSLDTRTNKIENQNNQIMNMLTNLTMQKQNPSGSGSLPSNTVANPRGDLKVITTQSGVGYDGPTILPTPSPLPKEVERETEATKDKVQTTSSESTAHVHPPVVQVLILMPEALADLGASINLMPLSVWKKLSLPELTPTRMTSISNRSVAVRDGVAEDVFVKVGMFYFPADFVVVDYDVDPWVPLILGRPFLRTARALIDVHGEELTLRVNIEAITFKVGHASRYSRNYYDETVHQVNVIDFACEGGELALLVKLLNNDHHLLSPLKKLNVEELKMIKSSIDDPPELELKDLPSHLEYMILEGTDKLPVIISKELKHEEKSALLKVLKSHKRAIAWKISDIKGIDPRFCTHKILMEDDFKPAVQHQRRVNSKIHEGGMTVVKNEDNELIPTRLVTGWHVCIDYRKLDDATRKDHFPLPFMDQMLERLGGNEYYCFLDGFSGYFQIPIEPGKTRDEPLSTCPQWDVCLTEHAFLVYVMSPGTFHKEKCHFMVKEDIVLGHKISKSGIEVDKAKVDVIAKLPHPTSVKGVRRADNLAVNHLSRLENPHQSDLEKKEITETFPLETLGMVTFRGDSSTPWFADISNYHAGNFIVKGMSS
ncbi:reverse transcriptase domain-containing protein [Tanacetum coccineum]|uniref:Reverse transcriptase domain-containing protein n=1 Tax=Tanacetum coccineum TaxID=301880 RepID=A0ABQ5HI26_9ASTR